MGKKHKFSRKLYRPRPAYPLHPFFFFFFFYIRYPHHPQNNPGHAMSIVTRPTGFYGHVTFWFKKPRPGPGAQWGHIIRPYDFEQRRCKNTFFSALKWVSYPLWIWYFKAAKWAPRPMIGLGPGACAEPRVWELIFWQSGEKLAFGVEKLEKKCQILG